MSKLENPLNNRGFTIRRLSRAATWLAVPVAWLWAATVPADYSVDTDYVNPWYNTNVPNAALTSLVANTTVGYGGQVGPYQQPGIAGAGQYPSGGGFRLASSTIAAPLAELVPDCHIGDIIYPPELAARMVAPISIFPSNGAFYSSYSGNLVAADHGRIEVQWLMMDGTTNTMLYQVSGVPSQRPVRLYWTERPFYAPAVDLSGKFVKLHYNSDIPAPPAGVPASNYTTAVWLDDINSTKLLRAVGLSGIFVLEYFATGKFDQQIGWEVVQVMGPDIVVQAVNIGDRLYPSDTSYGISNLVANVTHGVGEGNLYVHQSTDGKSDMEGWLYSIYRTSYNPWDAEVYWMHPGKLSVLWPYEVDWYDADWPQVCQLFTYGEVGQSAPVLIDDSLSPAIMPMEDPIGNTTMNSGVLTMNSSGLVLMRYSSVNEDIWFQVVRAVSHDNVALYDLMPQSATVAQEIRPTIGHSALALNDFTCMDAGTGPTILGRMPRTVEMWANIQSFDNRYLFQMGTNNGAASLFALLPTSTPEVWQVVLGGGVTASVTLPGSLTNWHHYALTYDGSQATLYYDAVPTATVTVALNTLPGPFLVGQYSLSGSSSARAYVEDVRVWYGARTAEQLANNRLRRLGFADLTHSDLVAYYPLNSSGGSNALDIAHGHDALVHSPIGYVASTAPDLYDLSMWTNYLGFVYQPFGWSYNPNLYDYRTQMSDPTNSWIYPVHTNQLEVWWANKYQQAGMPVPIYWPSLVTRYAPQWPTNADTIVIAHQGENVDANNLPANANNAIVYYQNDPPRPGFNPNEEHALIIGNSMYAIRNDLNNTNQPDSSAPFVLVQYNDVYSGLPQMLARAVVATNLDYNFNYSIVAGNIIAPPMPLFSLANCKNTSVFGGPAWKDRNQQWWAYRAEANGGNNEHAYMGFFYPNQPGFYYPGMGAQQPALGQEIPWLSGQSATGIPQTVTYTIGWGEAPVLYVNDTLYKAKNGLPDMSGQLSVDMLWQQSQGHAFVTNIQKPAGGITLTTVVEVATDNNRSGVVIDPTRYRYVPLAAVPSAIQTQERGGLKFFPDLPPQLADRMWWDPAAQRLYVKGQYVEEVGQSYLLLNMLEADERAAALALSSDSAWQTAVNAMPTNVFEIADGNTPADSMALSAGVGKGKGYVTFAVNNGTNVPPGLPISVYVVQILPPLYVGEIKEIKPSDPLDEQLTMRHTSDCAGHPENYQFEWRYAEPINGMPPDTNYATWLFFDSQPGLNKITFGAGTPIFTLANHFFTMRYKPLDPLNPAGTNWSSWVEPMIAESWVQRAMEAINPYLQRVTDYEMNPPDYTINMLKLAGEPYQGDIALNMEHINDYGLIQIYWTIFNRAMNMSIAIGISDGAINNTLKYAATRLNALYMLLGNEAYGDAMDPTIGYSAQSDWDSYGDILNRASAMFCFMNQLPTLMDEELCLLRGRDDTLMPNTREAPIFNRLIWNFTKSIDGGELAYALNYGIANQDGNLSGTLSETDARLLFPQGHGDAWGHYLSAVKLYYKLLHNTNYVWLAEITDMDVGGVTVTVDYYDEEKLAETAAARAKTGLDVVRRAFQQKYETTPSGLWQGYADTTTNRAWGVGEWASRVGQGTYFDWLAANSLLTSVDTNPTHHGIQVIDRTTVKALAALANAGRNVQQAVDAADGGLNPLGLSVNAMPFDISPSEIDAGKTHFEQIYERALAAVNNAQTVLDNAQGASQRLRRQASSFYNYVSDTMVQNDRNAKNRLLAILGTPYADDIGPGQPYPDGYTGPDFYHYMYVDLSSIGGYPPASTTFTATLANIHQPYHSPDVTSFTTNGFDLMHVPFSVNNLGMPAKPTTWTGRRARPGEYQMALLRYYQGMYEMKARVSELNDLVSATEALMNSFNARGHLLHKGYDIVFIANEAIAGAKILTSMIFGKVANDFHTEAINDLLEFNATGWGMPLVEGLADDAIAPARMAALEGGANLFRIENMAAARAQNASKMVDLAIWIYSQVMQSINYQNVNNGQLASIISQIVLNLQAQQPILQEIYEQALQCDELAMQVFALENEAQTIHAQLTSDRAAAALRIQSARYADMTLRLFRDEALRQYSDAYSLASRYAYLAARAYDYETALLGGDPTVVAGCEFMDRILRTRSLGAIVNGVPQVTDRYGDPGLADALARMKADWDVLKGRLGFNNPDTETSRFSLRQELFRIPGTAAFDDVWHNTLEKYIVSDINQVGAYSYYCRPVSGLTNAEPGLVIPFSTTITAGKNFFGLDLAGGDNAYDPTHAATKIRSVGVWFVNYNNAFATNSTGGLANEPRVYLVPLGMDIMRSPTRNSSAERCWMVVDQALPVPYNVTQADLDEPAWIPYYDSLSEDFAAIRRFATLRAYHDSGSFDASELCTNARLIGRSVWNTGWVLIIPGRLLLSDPAEGVQRFVFGPLDATGTRTGNGVTDIKLFFNTYSFSGE